MRDQAQDEPQWFAFRTDVSLSAEPRPRTLLSWFVLIVAVCTGCAAFAWSIGFDTEPIVQGLDRLSRLLGFVPA